MISPINPQGGAYSSKKAEGVKNLQGPKEGAPQATTPSDSSQVNFKSGGLNVGALLSETAEAALDIEKGLPDHVPGEVIVKLKPSFAHVQNDVLGTLKSFAEDYGGEVTKKFEIPDSMFKSFNGEMVLMKLPEGMTTAQAMAAMGKDDRVEYAASNDLIQAGPVEVHEFDSLEEVPDDLNPKLYGLHNEGQTGGTDDADIDAPEAWQLETGKGQAAGGPIIAVIDSGVKFDHEALKGNMWVNPDETADGNDTDGNGVVDDIHGFNAINKSGNPMDDNDHGTHCAVTIAASGDNSQGVYGVMQNAQIMGVKFLNARGGGTLAGAIDSVLYATKMGARVTSNSWGGGGFNQALFDAFKSSPALHIMAAGNERNNNDARPSYPANFDLPNVISVAATDHNDNLAGFSNYGGKTVHLAAPGVNILSATSKGEKAYASFSGTSMATPHVSGVAGLLLSQNPELTNDELKALILDTVDKKPNLEGKTTTGGRLNAHNALQAGAKLLEERLSEAAKNETQA